MRPSSIDLDAPGHARRGVLFALTTAALIGSLGMAGCSHAADEPVSETPATVATATPSVEVTQPPASDTDVAAGPLMAEKVVTFMRGYMSADVDLLVSAMSASNAQTIQEVAPALKMMGAIGMVVSETETDDGVVLETVEEDATTYVLVPLDAEGLSLTTTSWQGTAEERRTEWETVYTFVIENGGYRLDTIDGAPASSVLVQ